MLYTLGIIGLVIAALLVAFIIWRWTSVRRGCQQRDEKLFRRLDLVTNKINAGEAVSPEEIETLASRPEIRHMLCATLRYMKRPDLLPPRFASSAAQGEAALAYWLMHRNELQDAPEAIELLETVKRTVDGHQADFHVYRYKMPTGHWAAKDGWLLGLAGPMIFLAEPYSHMPAAFSRAGDLEGKINPSELVDWYLGMMRQKGIAA